MQMILETRNFVNWKLTDNLVRLLEFLNGTLVDTIKTDE